MCPLQIVAMIPPTPSNLSCYAAWLPKSKSEMAFLAANCKGASAQQVIMRPGETLLIPGQHLAWHLLWQLSTICCKSPLLMTAMLTMGLGETLQLLGHPLAE